MFGKGIRPPVHLTLNLPDFNGVDDLNGMISGDSEPAMVHIGDQMPVWNTGDGDGNFGQKLVDRMEDDDVLNDTVVLPIVDILPESRDESGDLVGDVIIVDFVGVHLLRVESINVADEDVPGQGMNFVVDRIMGMVVPVVISQGDGAPESGGYASDSVVKLQLVR
jgi:hypothetical protein